MSNISFFHRFVIVALAAYTHIGFSSEKEKRDINTTKPAILGILSISTTVHIDAVLDSASRALLDQKIQQTKSYLESSTDSNDRLRVELAAWERARANWKNGDPIPNGVAYVVVLEGEGEICVVFYPLRQAPFVCYLDKTTYAIKDEPKRRRKAVDFSQTEKIND